MRPFVVGALDEAIELLLLLQEVVSRGLGRLLLQGQMHTLVAAVLLWLARLYAFDGDAGHQVARMITIAWRERVRILGRVRVLALPANDLFARTTSERNSLVIARSDGLETTVTGR